MVEGCHGWRLHPSFLTALRSGCHRIHAARNFLPCRDPSRIAGQGDLAQTFGNVQRRFVPVLAKHLVGAGPEFVVIDFQAGRLSEEGDQPARHHHTAKDRQMVVQDQDPVGPRLGTLQRWEELDLFPADAPTNSLLRQADPLSPVWRADHLLDCPQLLPVRTHHGPSQKCRHRAAQFRYLGQGLGHLREELRKPLLSILS